MIFQLLTAEKESKITKNITEIQVIKKQPSIGVGLVFLELLISFIVDIFFR